MLIPKRVSNQAKFHCQKLGCSQVDHMKREFNAMLKKRSLFHSMLPRQFRWTLVNQNVKGNQTAETHRTLASGVTKYWDDFHRLCKYRRKYLFMYLFVQQRLCLGSKNGFDVIKKIEFYQKKTHFRIAKKENYFFSPGEYTGLIYLIIPLLCHFTI